MPKTGFPYFFHKAAFEKIKKVLISVNTFSKKTTLKYAKTFLFLLLTFHQY